VNISEVVKTVDLEPIRLPKDFSGDLHLRVEVLKHGGRPPRYSARLWKLEFYRVQPSFQDGRKKRIVADEQVLVPFDTLIEQVKASSPAKVLREVIRRLQDRFSVRG